MIAQLEGKIARIKGNSVIVAVGGVGYQVFITPYTLGKIAGLDQVLLYTYTQVREDILALYGFLDETELTMFELLISVSGIGPKAALSLLSIADPKTIRTAVVNKDPNILTRVSGVGKKTAEKIIVELQNKVSSLDIEDQATALAGQEALEAMTAMGYSISEAREALKMVPENIDDVGARIRQALKNLAKK
jgi:Holliday junction DNA helicase RuvA